MTSPPRLNEGVDAQHQEQPCENHHQRQAHQRDALRKLPLYELGKESPRCGEETQERDSSRQVHGVHAHFRIEREHACGFDQHADERRDQRRDTSRSRLGCEITDQTQDNEEIAEDDGEFGHA